MARAPIKDPRRIPLMGCDDHLPPISPERLTASGLRSRFAALPEWLPEFRGDGLLLPEHRPSAASVLIGLVSRDDGLRVLLTQRAMHLNKHAGQISFPGGRYEVTDRDEIATALREAHEEIGLEPKRVEVLGALPTYTTVTHFMVTPVIGIVDPPAAFQPDPNEVDEIFEIPLGFLMSPANHQRRRLEWEGQTRDILSMPWQDPQAQTERFVWGATAAMLRNLYRLLAA